jgi:hypothetical protein
VDDTNPSLLVVLKGRNETVQLRILESRRQVTAIGSTVVGITCIAKPNPPKKYETTNRGKGGAVAWMIHETS